jgi:hypothetical protein
MSSSSPSIIGVVVSHPGQQLRYRNVAGSDARHATTTGTAARKLDRMSLSLAGRTLEKRVAFEELRVNERAGRVTFTRVPIGSVALFAKVIAAVKVPPRP